MIQFPSEIFFIYIKVFKTEKKLTVSFFQYFLPMYVFSKNISPDPIQ